MIRAILITIYTLLLPVIPAMSSESQSLQTMIDNAEPGTTILPPPGIYNGPLVITKSIVLDGRGKVTIDNRGKGTVIDILGDGVSIIGMRIVGSGDLHNDVDAGIHVKGKYNIIKDNVIEECLFGIVLEQASNNIVRRNHITSKGSSSLGVKGDAIRLWYSFHNKIENNTIRDSRDFVIWYSANNTISGNDIRNGRYGLHFMYGKYNLVENNIISKNSVGIFLMYSDDVLIRNNKLFQAHGNAGVGIGLKESSGVKIYGNEILYNSRGISLDLSPFEPDSVNNIYDNEIAFNSIGLVFLSDWKGNIIKNNRFKSNILPVTVASFAGATRNVWEGNFWGNYQGFDGDGDGYGDTPFMLKIYSDRLWIDKPWAAFFKGTPVLSLLDFLERLAPFSDPLLMLRDDKPRISEDFQPIAQNSGNVEQNQDQVTPKRLDPFGLDNN
ncbi:MAG: nitrous oxide reductase family maturation protein NosD [Hyphomicrobiales bacterium]|nr:nitrous oxide reductase family maturation protein NosD [Hyphomicrobiales bacterium]